jgi:threonine dehydratase
MTRTLEHVNLGDQAHELFDDYRDEIGDFSKVEDLEVEFPFLADDLARDFGARGLYLFRADDNEAGTFKVRGALMGTHMLQQQGKNRVRLASAGNHARGGAVAGRLLELDELNIGVPVNAPPEKQEGLYELLDSSRLRVFPIGSNFNETLEFIEQHPELGDLLPAFDDPNVVAGAGTMVDDILKVHPGIKHITAAVGGAGLVASILQRTEELDRPDITVHAIEVSGRNNGLSLSLEAGEIVNAPFVDPEFAGSAVRRIGEHTLKICQNNRERLQIHHITRSDVYFTMAQYQQGRHERLWTSIPGYEPTTMVAVAGLRTVAKQHPNEPTIVIGTGHNAPLPAYI